MRKISPRNMRITAARYPNDFAKFNELPAWFFEGAIISFVLDYYSTKQ